jgi:hypothetical protein
MSGTNEIFRFIAEHPIISLMTIAAILATITLIIKGLMGW